jgi:hypothetical protein
VIIDFKYRGQSAIVQGLESARMTFAANTVREAAFFKGTLARPLVFREALGALHQVVTSDLKYRPRDRFAFRAWLEEQDRLFLAKLAMKTEKTRLRVEQLEARRAELDKAQEGRLGPFYQARRAYFDYVFTHEYELNYLLDPVITVHPDELFFEAFSKDESSYARVGARYDLFERIDAFECGTTNIDFSGHLAGELDRIRTYRRTEFDVTPDGFGVKVGDAPAHREKKIDLPDSWVNGFLQVQSTMAMGLTRLRLAPIDVYSILRALRRRKARTSPRALRYELVPGKRVKVVLEPWEDALELSPASLYEGDKPKTIRTWGRDRLRLLGRLLPVARHVDVYLAGLGLPSIYIADLSEVSFTLALSGWTDNDWTGGAKFDLLTRRLDGTPEQLMLVYETLRATRSGTDADVAQRAKLGVEKTRSVLSHLCQVGRAMYDLSTGKYRHRDLFLAPFTIKDAAKALKPAVVAAAPEAQAAQAIHAAEDVRIIARRPFSGGFKLSGSAKGASGQRVRPLITVNMKGEIVEGTCTCPFFKSHGLTQGPCEHLLALRLAHMKRLEAEDEKGGASGKEG